jgi:hypothetical protein
VSVQVSECSCLATHSLTHSLTHLHQVHGVHEARGSDGGSASAHEGLQRLGERGGGRGVHDASVCVSE